MSYFRHPRTTQEKRRTYRDGKYVRPGRSARLLPHAWQDFHKDESKMPKRRCPTCGQKRWWIHLYGNWWECVGTSRRDCRTQIEVRRKARRDRSTIRLARGSSSR